MRGFVILVAKLAAFVGRLIGKGSSLPGGIALKLCPNILKQLTLPPLVIAVTGSNGKTSTVEMIARILRQNGQRVIYNAEGSNQIEGVTTLLLRYATPGGKVQADAVVLESDERYARHTFAHFTPTHFAVTNLYRDQLTRNGHPDWICEIIADAISPETRLLLNADDPLVASLGAGRPNTLYFGMAKNAYSTTTPTGCYQDGAYCPLCMSPMAYADYHFAHLGHWHCTSCDYATPSYDFCVTQADLEAGYMTVNGQYQVRLAFAGRYNLYNLLTAFAVCSLAGLEGEKIAAGLSDYVMKTGRVVQFEAGQNHGVLLTSKHENSVSYQLNLEYIISRPHPSNVVVLVDAISRKYYTAETSWLWDIPFELLKDQKVEKLVLCGRYAHDLAARFDLAGFDAADYVLLPNTADLGALLQAPTQNPWYVVTCFSDKDKLLGQVKATTPVAK